MIIMKIETLTIETEVLLMLGKLHVITHEQLFRLFPDFERKLINNALNTLKELDYLYIKEYKIPAPNSGIINSNTRRVLVTTYALNYKSRPVIKKKFLELILYRREGPVRLHHRKRIYHDLLIVEALIYLSKRYEIADFYNEEYQQRLGLPMVDLRLKILSGDSAFDFLDVEVVVGNNKKAILAKPDDCLFFTYSSYQADIIKELKGVNPVIVTVDGDEIKTQKEDFTSDKYDQYYEYIYYLECREGALTARALAIAFEKDEEETASILKELEENGHLFSDRAHINIGDRGKRPQIYAINRQLLAEREDRVLALMCSNLIVELKDEIAFGSLDRSKRIGYFLHKSGEHRVYYFDNANSTKL